MGKGGVEVERISPLSLDWAVYGRCMNMLASARAGSPAAFFFSPSSRMRVHVSPPCMNWQDIQHAMSQQCRRRQRVLQE